MKPSTLAKILPAALSILPIPDSPESRALLIAIALQESGLRARRQAMNGPARSYWQFEKIGIKGLLEHHSIKNKAILFDLCTELDALPSVDALHAAIEHNDLLAIGLARLLLWTHPEPLPGRDEGQAAWRYYESLWKPGKPRPEAWERNWQTAWSVVSD